jgi:cysteine desulfurase
MTAPEDTMDRLVYFDTSATTPLDPRVAEIMTDVWAKDWGNPNSLYELGRRAYRTLESAREQVMEDLNAKHPAEILFTSGGTEADNSALLGIGATLRSRGKGAHVIVSAYEHHAVLHTAESMAKNGYEVEFLKPREDGVVWPEDLAAMLRDDTILVSVMHGNNELGTINDIKALAAVAHERGALFHTDAVQTLGKIPFDVEDLGVDAAAFSAHKFYGPRGVGALYLKKGTPYSPFILGGGQEFKKRSGTQNVAGNVGFAKALHYMLEDQAEEGARLAALRDKLVDGVFERLTNVDLNGKDAANRLPQIANLIIKGVEGEAMLLQLDNKGIAVSTGSACSSGSLEPSHVLLAIGCPPELAHGSLRVSLGRMTKSEDVDYFLEVFPPIIERLRSMNPLYDRMYGSGAKA